jgi:hypothetical protein
LLDRVSGKELNAAQLNPGLDQMTQRFTIILRSVCVGIASVVGAILLGVFVGLPVAFYLLSRGPATEGGGEVGWDLVSVAHNYAVPSVLFPLFIFVIGFYVGFRHFSRSQAYK